MEMVSAAKLRRVQDRMVAIRPYVDKLQAVVHNLIASLDTGLIKHPFMKIDSASPTIKGNSVSGKSIMAIVIAGDKGLCGGYNTNLIRKALWFFNQPEWSKVKLVAIGRKVIDYFSRHPLDRIEIVTRYIRLPMDIDLKQVREMVQPVTQAYLEGKISEVWLLYTTYVNAMVYKPQVTRLLPILVGVPFPTGSAQKKMLQGPRRDGVGTNGSGVPYGIPLGINALLPAAQLPYGFLYEPQPEVILELLLPKYLDLLFYRTILEALASEQSARMIAMSNATENAQEVIDGLKLTFNKARQAGITKELLDIVGGVEAMRG
jgi:F-type H+-transporting ATPase subunit gamma